MDSLERLGADFYKAVERGVLLESVVDSHLHTDHVSIGRSLTEASGAPYQLSREAEVSSPLEPLGPGDEFMVGSLSLRVVRAPGYAPDNIALLGARTTPGSSCPGIRSSWGTWPAPTSSCPTPTRPSRGGSESSMPPSSKPP